MRVAVMSYDHYHNTVGSARSKFVEYNLIHNKIHHTVFSKKDIRKKGGNNLFIFILWLFISCVKITMGNYDKLYVTAPPIYSLIIIPLVRLFLKRIYIIMDLRDPISYNMYKKGQKIKADIIVFLERLSYRYCNVFFVCTKGMEDYYTGLFRNTDKLKIAENGCDNSMMTKITRHNSINKDVIVCICAGKLYSYSPEYCQILGEFYKRLSTHMPVKYIHYGIEEPLITLYSTIENFDFSYTKERILYKEVLKGIISSDIGIFLVCDEKTEYGTKIFEYLYLDRLSLTVCNKDSALYNRFSGDDKFLSIFPDLSNMDEIIDKILRIKKAQDLNFKTNLHYSRKISMQNLINELVL